MKDIIIITFRSLPAVHRAQLVAHVLAYAEMLHSWRLIQKRAELFNAVKINDPMLGDSTLGRSSLFSHY